MLAHVSCAREMYIIRQLLRRCSSYCSNGSCMENVTKRVLGVGIEYLAFVCVVGSIVGQS